MSERIPESIPTSADPRSRRLTKKARGATTPLSLQNAAVTALFEKQPDIQIPTSSTQAARTSASLPPPPEIVANVQGSSAGAGSGEFHVYKASRRREYERVRLMEEEDKVEKANKAWNEKREREKKRDEARTSKNQRRREKMRSKKGKEEAQDGGGKENGAVRGEGTRGVVARMEVDRLSDGGNTGDENEVVLAPEEKGILIHDED